MPQWINILLTMFYLCWLIAVLLFLWLIWRTGARHAQRLEETIIEAMQTTAQAAREAAQAARVLSCCTVQGDEARPVLEEGGKTPRS